MNIWQFFTDNPWKFWGVVVGVVWCFSLGAFVLGTFADRTKRIVVRTISGAPDMSEENGQ